MVEIDTTNQKKIEILNLDLNEFKEQLSEIGLKRFRFKQVSDWVYKKFNFDFHEMSNLSKDLRQELDRSFTISIPNIENLVRSDDGSEKFLLKLEDDNLIEMVIIPAGKKNTLCVSSQVGCKRFCQFCATGKLGLSRDLEVFEIISQVLLACKHLGSSKLTNIVFMGMGEPLDNYDNVIKAIRILQHDSGLKFSPRRITVSTCGVIPGIKKLQMEDLKVKLAVSLNSAIPRNRDILMPVNKIYPLDELKKSLQEFRRLTNFRITFEYIMISNFNMNEEDIKALRKFVGDISCKINLIPWNKVENLPYETPTEKEINNFRESLEKNLSVAITIRNSRGSDISAACGQLAGRSKNS